MAHDSYSALSDLTRRRILTALSHGARPVGELVRELEVSQPTVSKHLKVLRDVGLVTTRAEGQRRYYSIEVETLADVARWIEELIGYLPAPEQGPALDPEPEQGTALGPELEALDPEAEPAAENPGEPAAEPGAPEAEPVAANPGEPTPAPGAPEAGPEAANPGEPAAEAPAVREPRPLPWFAVAAAEEADPPEDAERSGTGPGAGSDSERGGPEAAEILVFDVIGEQDTAVAAAEAAEAAAHDPLPGTRVGETTWEKTVLPQSENQDAGSTVETDTDVNSAATSEGSPGSAESSLTKPEPGIPLVRSGAAHRRQGGLLSTLTGFRRRGRGQRR